MATKKRKRSWSTVFIVHLYAIVVAVLMALQAGILMMGKLIEADIIVVHTSAFQMMEKFVNGELALPIGVLATMWIALVTAYVGADRAGAFIHSQKLEYLQRDVGNPRKLRMIILASGLLFAWGVTLSTLVDFDFALAQFATAFGSTCTLYVAGQKAISAARYTEGHHSYTKDGKVDDNHNGIPDEEEAVTAKFESAAQAMTNFTSGVSPNPEEAVNAVRSVTREINGDM